MQCESGKCSANVVGVEATDCDAALNAEKCFTKIGKFLFLIFNSSNIRFNL